MVSVCVCVCVRLFKCIINDLDLIFDLIYIFKKTSSDCSLCREYEGNLNLLQCIREKNVLRVFLIKN